MQKQAGLFDNVKKRNYEFCQRMSFQWLQEKGFFCLTPKQWPDNHYHGLCMIAGEDKPGERIYAQDLDICPLTGKRKDESNQELSQDAHDLIMRRLSFDMMKHK